MSALIQYDPDIGFRFVPHLKLRINSQEGGFLLRTNGIGFRNNREFDAARAKGRRVLVFGDSFTAGNNVSNGDRFTDRLEGLFPGVEFHNFGLPGTGTDQHYIAYRKFAGSVVEDVVVIVVLVENIRRIISPYKPSQNLSGEVEFVPKPYFELHEGELIRRHDPVPRERISGASLAADSSVNRGGRYPQLRKLVHKLGLQRVIQQMTKYQPTPEYDDPNNSAWRLMRALLLAWRQAIPGPAILVPLPLYQHIEGTADPGAYQTRFGELATEAGFVLHDPLPDLHAYSPAERRAFRFQTDVHLTPAGHWAVAQSLATTLLPVLKPEPSEGEAG